MATHMFWRPNRFCITVQAFISPKCTLVQIDIFLDPVISIIEDLLYFLDEYGKSSRLEAGPPFANLAYFKTVLDHCRW